MSVEGFAGVRRHTDEALLVMVSQIPISVVVLRCGPQDLLRLLRYAAEGHYLMRSYEVRFVERHVKNLKVKGLM
jgi:hypothetical protein